MLDCKQDDPGDDLDAEAAGVAVERSRDTGGSDRCWLVALLLVHVVSWTVYGVFALGVGALHDDMIEAWNWAQEPQLGYYKHPPLFAWVTCAWFRIFPVADWSFYMMAATNAAIGLAGVAALARFFGLAAYRTTAVALLMLSPLYGFLALKFNANAVLIPLWPWATYAMLRSLETRRVLHAVALGLLTGLAILGKYYSVLLAVAFLVVALLPAYRARYWRSPAPYVAFLVAVLVVGPHAIWTVENGYPTVAYALSKFRYNYGELFGWAIETTAAPATFLAIPLVVMAVAARCAPRVALERIWSWLTSRGHTALIVIAALPFLMTLFFGYFGHAKISVSYTIPIFFMAPLIMLSALPADRRLAVARVVPRLAAGFSVCVMLVAPLVAAWRYETRNELVVTPLRELATEATRIWHDRIGAPLRIVASSDRFFGALSFYSADQPAFFINMNTHHAPWITDARIAAEGLLMVCRTGNRECMGHLERHAPNGDRVDLALQREWRGKALPTAHYTLAMVRPRN